MRFFIILVFFFGFVTSLFAFENNDQIKRKLDQISSEIFEEAYLKLGSIEKIDIDSFRRKLTERQFQDDLKKKFILSVKNNLPELISSSVNQMSGFILDDAKKFIDTSLNEEIEKIGDQWFDYAVLQLNSRIDLCEKFREQDFCRFIKTNLNVADIKGSFSSVFSMENIEGLVSYSLGRALSQGLVSDISERLFNAFDGRLPAEVERYLGLPEEKFREYSDKYKSYLPGQKLNEELNSPLVVMPNSAYVPILAGAAAKHYSAFIESCTIMGCTNVAELKRAIEVTRVLVWQASNKEGISLSVVNFFDFLKKAAADLGIKDIEAFSKFKMDLGQFKSKLDKISQLANEIDSKLSAPLDSLGNKLSGVVGEIRDELTGLQNSILEPFKNGFAVVGEGVENLSSQFSDFLGDFNGIPRPDFSNFLGDFGNFNPYEEFKEIKEEVLNELENVVSSGLADPWNAEETAEIKDEEKIPPQNESPSVEKPSDKYDSETVFDPVYLHNGEFYYKIRDIFGVDGLSYARIYRSSNGELGPLGRGWRDNLSERLIISGEKAVWVDSDGKKFLFEKNGEKFTPQTGIFAELKLVKNNRINSYLLVSRDEKKRIFSETGLLVAVINKDNKIVLHYDEKLRLKYVTSSDAKIIFSYKSDGLLKKVSASNGAFVTFLYDDEKNLTTAKYSDAEIRYFYSSKEGVNKNKLLEISDPRGSVYLRNVYGENGIETGRVVEQFYGDDKFHITASYQNISSDNKMNSVSGRTYVKNKRGVTRIYEHNSFGNLLNLWIVSGSNVEPLIWHKYNDDGMRILTAFPSGRYIIREYDSHSYSEMYHGDLLSEAECFLEKGQKEYFLNSSCRFNRQKNSGQEFQLRRQSQRPSPVRHYYDRNGNVRRGEIGDSAIEFDYDILDRVIAKREWIEKDQFLETLYFYDSDENLIKIVWPEKNYTEYEYDYRDRIIKIVQGDSTGVLFSSSMSYDLDDNIISIKDSFGREDEFRYNGYGDLVYKKNASGKVVLYEWDLSGNFTGKKIFGRNGLLFEASLEYDERGNVNLFKKRLWKEDPLKSKWVETKLERDENENIVKILEPEGEITQFVYNAKGELIETKYGNGESVKFKRDADRRLIEEERENHAVTAYSYDKFGRLFSVTKPLGGKYIFEHNEVGLVTKITDPEGKTKEFGYDLIGRPISIVYGGKYKNSFVWDKNGRLKQIRDFSGDYTSYSYDGLNRLILELYPDNSSLRRTFKNGNLISVKKRNDEVINYEYDQSRNFIKRYSGNYLQEYLYDDLGRLVYSFDNNGSSETNFHSRDWYYYDSFSRMIAENQNGSWVVRDYKDSGETRALSYPDGSIYYFGDIAEHSPRINRYFNIEGLLEKSVFLSGFTGKILSGYKYSYDQSGRASLKEEMVSLNENSYEYDELSRLTKVGAEGIIYDSKGNVLTQDLNTIYDSDGRITGFKNLKIIYDPFNRVKNIETEGSVVATYLYDGLNRRISKRTSEENSFYYYDRYNTITLDSKIKSMNYYYDHSDNLLTSNDINNRKLYYFTDRNGSILNIFDPEINRLETVEYSAYGNVGHLSDMGKFYFAGKEYDPESGFYYFINRYYSSELGRFITPDPLGYKNSYFADSIFLMPVSFSFHKGFEGINSEFLSQIYLKNVDFKYPENNLYEYALSDPINFVDPFGLWSLYVDLEPDRNVEGVWSLFGDLNGRMVGSGSALGRGLTDKLSGRPLDWTRENGATPTGIYRAGGFIPSNFTSDILPYGREARMILQPVAGNALIAAEKYGRNNLRVHEGREGYLQSRGKLMNTKGCIRFSPSDMAALNSAIADLVIQGDAEGFVYVRDVAN